MADGEGGNVVIPSMMEINGELSTQPVDIVYDIASKMFTNTNLNTIDMPIESWAKTCIYNAMVFRDVYENMKDNS